MSDRDIRAEAVTKLDPEPGDTILVVLGLTAEQFGDGQVAWIPGPEELEEARADWANVLPRGVYLLVTHIGHDVKILKG